jgi:hypothetical protein
LEYDIGREGASEEERSERIDKGNVLLGHLGRLSGLSRFCYAFFFGFGGGIETKN